MEAPKPASLVSGFRFQELGMNFPMELVTMSDNYTVQMLSFMAPQKRGKFGQWFSIPRE